MKFFMFNTTVMNILQAIILFVCRWFYMYGEEPNDSQTVVTPLHTNIQVVQKKPDIWRLGKNNLERFRLCFIPGFTAHNHPHFAVRNGRIIRCVRFAFDGTTEVGRQAAIK